MEKETEKKQKEEKTDILGIMRIIALTTLGFMVYWVFSDMELEKMEIRLVPMLYVMDQEMYLTKKLTVLIVPVLFNLALWIPRYAGYVLIRGMLYLEGIKYILLLGYYILGSMAGVVFAAVLFKSELLLSGFMLFYLWVLKMMDKELKTEDFRKYFKVGERTEKRLKRTAVIVAIVIYAGAYGSLVIESKIQESDGVEKGEEQTAKVTTYDKIELTKKKPYGNSFMEYNAYSKLRISPDGKKLLLTHESKTKQNVEIYDIATGKMLKKLDIFAPGAEFSPDGEQVIWMNFEGKKISLKVVNIESGAINSNFQDRKELQKKREEKGRKGGGIKIEFSPGGKYISVCVQAGGGVEIWDYKTGKLLDYYGIGENIEEIVWLSENKFLTVNEIFESSGGIGKLTDKEIYVHEIMPDGTVKRSKQEKLVSKMKSLDILSESIDDVRKGKEILISKGENGTFGRHSMRVKLLDIETGQAKFSLRLYNQATVLLDDKTDTLVAAEDLKSGKKKITIWNIDPKEKKKVLYVNLDKKEEWYAPSVIGIVDRGKKLVYLMKNKIHFVDLE